MKDGEYKSPIPKKMLVAVLLIFLLALFGGVGIVAYIGVFTEVKVEPYNAPSYRVAYILHTGPYNQVGPLFEQVATYLEEANITASTPAAMYLDNPSEVEDGKLRSKIGYLVAEGVVVPAPLEVENIPPRQVIRATFDGSPLLGSYKAYEAMREWAKFHRYTLTLPSLEIYHDGWSEYQLRFHGKK